MSHPTTETGARVGYSDVREACTVHIKWPTDVTMQDLSCLREAFERTYRRVEREVYKRLHAPDAS